MPTYVLARSMVLSLFALSAGCSNYASVQSASPESDPTADWRDSFFRFDDPRCSDDQRHAIRAATKAVIGTDQPSPELAKNLHFSFTESADGWSLNVWQFGLPNEVPLPGGFTAIDLNRDFTVRRVVGGA